MTDHIRLLIRSCLRHLACLEEEVEELDAEILRRMSTSPLKKAFELLQTVPGVGQLSAATILAETGTDLEPFPTAEQMASWAGLCPGNPTPDSLVTGAQPKPRSRRRREVAPVHHGRFHRTSGRSVSDAKPTASPASRSWQPAPIADDQPAWPYTPNVDAGRR